MIIYMDMYDNLYIDMTDFVSNIIVVSSYFNNCITSLSLNFDYSTDIYYYRVLDMVESLVKIQPPADLTVITFAEPYFLLLLIHNLYVSDPRLCFSIRNLYVSNPQLLSLLFFNR
jgi:hypothetical protein